MSRSNTHDWPMTSRTMAVLAFASAILAIHSSSFAQTAADAAAYCLQFKDYDGQRQCIRDFAKRSVDRLAEKCKRFTRYEDQILCWEDLTSSTEAREDPYCLPMTERQLSAIRMGRTVIVAGVDGCSQIWN